MKQNKPIHKKRLLELLTSNQGIFVPVPYPSKTPSQNFKIKFENILFVSKSLNNLSPRIFNVWFSYTSDQHQIKYETSSSTQGNLMKLFYKTNRYGKYSITVSAAESWNKIQKQHVT